MTTPTVKPAYKWYAGATDEYYTCGPFDTREDAIVNGRDNFDPPFHIVYGTTARWNPPRAEDIIYDLIETHCDVAFEDTDVEFDDPNNEAQDELQQLLNDWLNKHRHRCSDLRSFADSKNYEVVND